jgi:putative MATE family efflux protein
MNEHQLGTEKVGKLIAKFAIPSVVSMLVNALYNIVDQIFIGRGVGYLGNGAANVVLLITTITLALSLLLGDGAAAYFSLRLGEGKREDAARAVGNSFSVVLVGSIVTTIVVLLCLTPIVRLLGATDVILPYALDYGRIVSLGLPFIMVSTTLNSVIRADGSPRWAMASMAVGAIINGCLDPIFIFGFGWGIKGAAWSTVIGQLVSFVISICYLWRFQSVRLTRTCFRLRGSTLWDICRLGTTSFIGQGAFVLVMAVNNNLLVHYGAQSVYGSEIPLTAYGISMKVQEILYTVVLGIAIGMQPVVGYNYGAKKYRRVRHAYALAVLAGTIVSAAALVMFECVPEAIVHLFGLPDNPLYLEFSVRFFRIYFCLYLFFGFLTITGVFSQAIGKAGQAAVLSLSYQLVCKIGFALVLCTQMGLDGVLWSGPFADGIVFAVAGFMVCRQIRQIRAPERKQP